MARYLKWPANSGTANNTSGLVISGITGDLISVQYELAEDIGAKTDSIFLFDSRVSAGTVAYMLMTNGAEKAGVSNVQVNGLAISNEAFLYGAVAETPELWVKAGDVISFDVDAGVGESFVFGARSSFTDHFYGLAIKRIVVIDAAGTHEVNMNDGVVGETVLLSDTGSITATLQNFPNDGTHWVGQPTSGNIPVAVIGEVFSAMSGVDFTLDGSASFDSDGTIESYLWTQVNGVAACTINNPTNPITTVSSSVLDIPEEVVFRLVVTDNQGNESAPADISVTLLTENEGPLAVLEASSVTATQGQTIVLTASNASDTSGILSYRINQISGNLCDLGSRFSDSTSFIVPVVSSRTAYAQDIYAPQIASTPSQLNIPVALSKLLDISYLGAFKITYFNEYTGSSYSDGAFGLSENRDSLFVAGHTYEGAIGEFGIPVLSTSALYSDLPEAPVLQTYAPAITENTVNPMVNNRINGILAYDGKLLVTSELNYNTNDTSHNIQFLSSSLDLFGSVNVGLMRLQGGSYSGGWMSKVPTSAVSLVGGQYISGWSTVYSIVSRYSQGPSLYTFNPDDVVQSSAGDLIPTTEIIAYPFGGNTLVSGSDVDKIDVSPLWGTTTKGLYGFIVPNSDLFVVLGTHGGTLSGTDYKATQSGGRVCGGSCPLITEDQNNYFWVYSLNDVMSANATYEPKPFAYGKWSHPFDGVSRTLMHGAAYDEVNEILYIKLNGANSDQGGLNTPDPTIIAYSLSAKTNEDISIGTENTNLVFELEITDGNGLKSTDTVTVSIDPSATPIVDTTPPVISLSPPQTVYNLTVGDTFTQPTATAIDSIDGVVTVNTSGTVNTATAGAYFLTYTATDSSGNTATRTVTVNVTPEVIIDATAPVITVSGQPITTIPFNGTAPVFTVTATDNIDGTLTAVQTGDTVNTGVAGTYVLRWNVTDSSGNAAQEVTRTVVVLPENVTPTTSMATVIVDGTPNGTYDVNFTNPTTGDLIDIQSLVFVGGRATTQIDVVAGTSFRAHVFTPTHLFGNVGVTV